MLMQGKTSLEIYKYHRKKNVLVPLVETKVNAGFPSPAQDYLEQKLVGCKVNGTR
jgi:hypothetical protein